MGCICHCNPIHVIYSVEEPTPCYAYSIFLFALKRYHPSIPAQVSKTMHVLLMPSQKPSPSKSILISLIYSCITPPRPTTVPIPGKVWYKKKLFTWTTDRKIVAALSFLSSTCLFASYWCYERRDGTEYQIKIFIRINFYLFKYSDKSKDNQF